MSGNFLRYSKGVKDPLEVPEVKCDLPGDTSAEMGLISLEGRTSWIFSSCGRSSRITTGTSGTRSGGPGKASPHASCSGASRDSSPVLTWILGYFWSLPRGVSPRLDWGHARALSFRAVAAVSLFPWRGSRILWFPLRLSHEAFPRGFPTGLSHVPPWCESILG